MTTDSKESVTVCTKTDSSLTKIAQSSPSCCSRVMRVEGMICKTGTAWGLLDGKPGYVLVAWWMLRHLIYGAMAIGLLIVLPSSSVVLIPFILFAHVYKAVMFIVCPVLKQRQERLEKMAEGQGYNATEKVTNGELDLENGGTERKDRHDSKETAKTVAEGASD